MKKLILMTGLAIFPTQVPAADSWQECQIENVTYCNADGCQNVEPTLKLFFGDYAGPDGTPKGYYYRCRRDGPCDRIENPWIGEKDGYRAFVMREQGVIARIGPDSRVTDVSTLNDTVVISRGSCWNGEPQNKRSDQSAGN